MKFYLLVSVLSVSLADGAVKCNYDENTSEVIRYTLRSDTTEDATAVQTCPKGYALTGCECQSNADDPNGCDGAIFESNVDGDRCIAYNAAGGKGVVAKVTCQQIIITCSSGYEDMPSVSCPTNYKLNSCGFHTNYMQALNHGLHEKPQLTREGGKCFTTAGCTDCMVQARCVRVTG